VNAAFLGLLSSTGDSNFSSFSSNGFSSFSSRLLFKKGHKFGESFQRKGVLHFVCKTRQEKSHARARTRLLRSMLESHSSYGGLQACQSWLPDFLSTTNPSAAAGGKVQRAQVQQANRCLQECNDEEERICAHCGTSKTPLWRNGPQGPKSLCNACGIRHKKAGRRSAALVSSEFEDGHSIIAGAGKGGKRKLEQVLGQQYWMYQQARKQRGEVYAQPRDSLLSSGASCITWQQSLLPSAQSPLQHNCHQPLPSIQEEDMLEMCAFASDEEEGAALLMALSHSGCLKC
jgi:ribosomal protein L37E